MSYRQFFSRLFLPAVLGVSLLLAADGTAAVDTLKGTAVIEDGTIYSWEDCNAEIVGEDCRRYNAGGTTHLQVGSSAAGRDRRALFRLPGWNGVVPDSSHLLLYCKAETDTLDRKIFLYPLTRQFIEGTELAYNIGDYPSPDSGVTWFHAWLDVGDGDSLNWSSAGGDYTTAVACTITVSGVDRYVSCTTFNRILTYWDTSGQAYGFILVNQNAFPANTSMKTFGSTEGSSSQVPMVVLYFGSSIDPRRCRIIQQQRYR